jgi:hypothetical protein
MEVEYITSTLLPLRFTFENPPETRHFHFTAVDPYTNDIYTSLGDVHKAKVTGIMRSQDQGKNWEWIHRARSGLREAHHQPTAVYFDRDTIYFGSDSRPHGIFTLNRHSRKFEQVFTMSKNLKSWFSAITKVKGSFWAISRSFTDLPTPSFGLLWWSGDGRDWLPIQTFEDAPVWLEADDENLISVGFWGNSNVAVFDVPQALQMADWISRGPKITLLDQFFEELRGPLEQLGWSSATQPPAGTR